MDVEKMKVFYDREIGLIVGVIDDDIMIIDHIDRSIVKHPLIFGRYDINSKDRILLRFGLLRYDEKWEPGVRIPQYVVEKMPQEFQDLLKLSYKDDLELY